MIHLMEELSYNAWASLQNLYYDGWILRFADGYTRRANSVNPIYPSSLDLNEKIAYCENVYRLRGQRTVFKMTEAAQPHELDGLLEELDYEEDARTSVQIHPLTGIPMPSDNICTVDEKLNEKWLDSYCRLNHISDKRRDTLRKILANVVPKTGYVSAQQNGMTVAVGMGVLDGEYLGIYNLITDEAFRRRGIGTEVILNLLDWGIDHQAKTAYLQVMTNNEPAQNMYSRLGFQETYQYWYRVKR